MEKNKIAVALSGGIDSSATAWLLQQSGADVTGVTMHHFDDEELGFSAENGIAATIRQSKKVCEFLHIPHLVVDLRQEFREIVMQYFTSEYKNGRTPNPCTLCNRKIKWGVFLQKILEQGFDFMATGHYIRLTGEKNGFHLYRGSDAHKDQSYMLWQLNQEQLAKTLFPLGEWQKTRIKELIRQQQLPVRTDYESQEVCFISKHYREFLKTRIPFFPGDIVLTSGEKIGRHFGLPLYTIGQRKGLQTRCNEQLFVKELDVKNNRLLVTAQPEDLNRYSFSLTSLNWIAGDPPESSLNLFVQIRYNSPPEEVENLQWQQNRLLVTLNNPTRAVTPGQSAVFYFQDELLGGGIIDE